MQSVRPSLPDSSGRERQAATYGGLRSLASHFLGRERRDHTLQPTALVHEVYLRMADQTSSTWKDKAHFLGIAARVM